VTEQLAAKPAAITLLTDYGLDDEFAGVCRGVIKRIAPAADVIDITHGIGPQQVLRGALVLAETLPYMPNGVHVAVVDPEVGGPRRPLALRGGDGRLYVGPDNGVLLLAAERLGGVLEAVEITNRQFMLEPVSPTFHGRDVFAPAAAHLALGLALSEFGPSVDPRELIRLELPPPRVEKGRIQATILRVDRFGNIRLNVAGGDLEHAGIALRSHVEVEVASRRYSAVVARVFADVRPGELVLYEDSSRSLALAVNLGSAARLLATMEGQEVTLVGEAE
jgi:S-adenosyl-L-methionine hydrolase (adenosine-forming)